MLNAIRKSYRKLVPKEWRQQIYKIRHPGHFKRLRSVVNPSEKGDFSLRGFDEQQCIFVHITKSAGTSVAKALFGAMPYHYTALDYRVIFGRKDFHRYFKFTFVRNPWDRLYSAYSYLKGGGWNDSDRLWADNHLSGFQDFEAFVTQGLDGDMLEQHIHFKPQMEFVCDRKGHLLVDYIGYFESIEQDFRHICNVIDNPATLGHTNKSRRVDYRDVYTREMRDIVASVYAEDIELFGYSFDQIVSRCEPTPLHQ